MCGTVIDFSHVVEEKVHHSIVICSQSIVDWNLVLVVFVVEGFKVVCIVLDIVLHNEVHFLKILL